MVRRLTLLVLAALMPVAARAGLPFSTLLGGAGSDDATVVVVTNGFVYIAGTTFSTNLPATAGAFDVSANGGSDAFVAKFDAGLSNLLALTLLGGNADDGARAMVVDSAGRVAIAGYTFSPNFPTSTGGQDTTYGGGGDAFVAQFDAGLSNLVASTFLGGSDYDDAFALAKDAASNVYVAGITASTNYPVAGAIPFDRTLGGARDAFVSRLNDSLAVLVASTFLGGSGTDGALAMKVDPSGDLVLAGDTASPNFPTTAGTFDTSLNSANDLFVTRMTTDLTNVPASTYIGPADAISAAGLALDASGRIYVATRTSAPGYPVLAGFDSSPNGGADIAVSLLSRDLTALVASTLLGGGADDSVFSLIVEPGGSVCVAGSSRSTDYPVTPGPVDGNYIGGAVVDAVVSRFNASLSALLSSTYLRGNGGDDAVHGLASGGAGSVYVVGATASSDFPVTPLAYDSTFNSAPPVPDSFVSKLSMLPRNTQGVDFDGDGRTDLVIFDKSTLSWYLSKTKEGFAKQQYGFGGVIPVPGDYDGDGRLDFAVYSPGSATWYISQTTAGLVTRQFGFGGVVPVPADYDGDGREDLAVYDPVAGVWYMMQSSAGFFSVQFGFRGVVPVPADYDGDGKADIGVFDGGAGNWYVFRSRAGFSLTQFGFTGVAPVPADYDGDGQADLAVYYKSSAGWYLLQSRAGFKAQQFGLGNVVPVPADYDGDSHADIAVYDLGTGYWKILESHAGSATTQFGYGGAVPVLTQYWINRAFGFP